MSKEALKERQETPMDMCEQSPVDHHRPSPDKPLSIHSTEQEANVVGMAPLSQRSTLLLIFSVLAVVWLVDVVHHDYTSSVGVREDQDWNTSSSLLKEIANRLIVEERQSHKVDTLNSHPEDKKTAEAFVPNDSGSWAQVQVPQTDDIIPNTVFFVWCGKCWLQFAHYLSIKSAIGQLRPELLIFYYDEEPVEDVQHYNTWYTELQEEYAFFHKVQVKADWNACTSSQTPNLQFVKRKLKEIGGMYLSMRTILNDFPLESMRSYTVVSALDSSEHGFIMAKQGIDVDEVGLDSDPTKYMRVECAADNVTFDKMVDKPMCVSPSLELYPQAIWELDTDFGRLARRTFYGREETLAPKQSYDTLAPNIAHIVWIGGGEMDYLFYLGVLSLVHVAEVDGVYIHGDMPPSGRYWDKVSQDSRVQWVHRELQTTVFGSEVRIRSHVSNIWRADSMIRYGGIYVDTDTIFVRPLTREIRAYDAVSSLGWSGASYPFPSHLNLGVAVGKRGAPFWHKFLESMKRFIENDWNFNGCRQPYKVKERHPDLVKLDSSLQVVCFKLLCHPTWGPDFRNASVHHVNTPGLLYDWHAQAFAYHLILINPPELASQQALEAYQGDSVFAEIGRYVLHKAGILNHTGAFKHTQLQLH